MPPKSSPVVADCAQSVICFRSARLCGAVPPFFSRTPWLALKYGAEKFTTRDRATVIVDSSNAKSKGFAPGRR